MKRTNSIHRNALTASHEMECRSGGTLPVNGSQILDGQRQPQWKFTRCLVFGQLASKAAAYRTEWVYQTRRSRYRRA
jgi:hypothetical protein